MLSSNDGVAYLGTTDASTEPSVGGLKIIDVATGGTPTLLGQQEIIRPVTSVTLSSNNEVAYLSASDFGVKFLDVNSVDENGVLSLQELGEYDPSGDGGYINRLGVAFGDGELLVTATQTLPTGEQSGPFNRIVFVDSVAPLPPTITPLPVTQNRRPVLHGTGEPGATITIKFDSDQNGSADTNVVDPFTVSSSGKWSITPDSDLVTNATTLRTVVLSAVQVDAAGNASEVQTGIVEIFDDALAGVTITDLAATEDNRPTISGTAEPTEVGRVVTVTVLIDTDDDGTPDTVLGEVPTDNQGDWSLTAANWSAEAQAVLPTINGLPGLPPGAINERVYCSNCNTTNCN